MLKLLTPAPVKHFVCFQYLESVRPVLCEERFKEMERLAEDFKVWDLRKQYNL